MSYSRWIPLESNPDVIKEHDVLFLLIYQISSSSQVLNSVRLAHVRILIANAMLRQSFLAVVR